MANSRAFSTLTLVGCILAGGLLTGCSSNLKVSEIQKDVKSVTFIQIGKEPHAYDFGVVDPASFWSKADMASVPSASALGLSEAAHLTAQSTATLAGGVAEDVFTQKQKELKDKFRNLIDGSQLTSEITHELMPVIAQAWNISYNPEKLGVYHVDDWEINEDGSFSLLDPETDLVITFGIDKVRLNEKHSVGGFFSTLATLGFNDKPVAPELYGRAIVFKRDPKSNTLMKVWETSCLVNTVSMSDSEKFSVLIESPRIAKPMFEEASAKFIQFCTRKIRGHSGT
jgi:hypothetical protein